MIIIEGVDKAGKTTLAQTLLLQFGHPVKHFGVPTGDPIPEYIKELEEQDKIAIYDRFLFGEVPYSIVKKRTRYMKYLELRVLDLMLQSRPHLVVYCRPMREAILARIKELGDDYIAAHEAMALYDEYDEMFSAVKTPYVMMYSGKESEYLEITRFIKHLITEDIYKRYFAWKDLKHPGIGTLSPKYLFVGDKYNYNAPYQVTFCSQSGEYLFRSLDDAGFRMQDCHFTNAFSGPDMITSNLIQLLKPNIIIALGDIAYDALSRCNLEGVDKLIKIQHPSYHKRFQTNSEKDYATILSEVK